MATDNATISTFTSEAMVKALQSYCKSHPIDDKPQVVATFVRNTLATAIGFDLKPFYASVERSKQARIAKREAAKLERKAQAEREAAIVKANQERVSAILTTVSVADLEAAIALLAASKATVSEVAAS